MRADILFLGVDGFDLEAGLTTPNLLQSRLNRTMVGRSPRGGACDSAKFERCSLFQTVPS